jgi:hypothetical protein
MLHPLDEFPVHQTPQSMSQLGTSDKNFYDRCYFNAHDRTGDTFLITGLGTYANLGVIDAYATVKRGDADDHGVGFDLTWEGSFPAVEEEPHDADWAHGQWKGAGWAESVVVDLNDLEIRSRIPFGNIDHVARAVCDGAEGWGLFEHASIGAHAPTGFTDLMSVAP